MYIDSVKERLKDVEFNILCIDNKIIRHKIENVLGVAELPCILVYKQDQIETYSGQDSYRWLDEMIRITTPNTHEKNKTLLYDDRFSGAGGDRFSGGAMPDRFSGSNGVSLGSAGGEEDEDDNTNKKGITSTVSDRNNHFGKQQPLSIRKNAGNYDYDIQSSTEEDNKEIPEDNLKKDAIVTNGIKKNNANGKKQNIVAMATAMQKSREEFDYSKKK
jgi:hypothetical protein